MISLIYSNNTMIKTSGKAPAFASKYIGLSSDEKPTDTTIPNGTEFYEMDTGKTYYFDATPDAETPWVTTDGD